MGLEGRGKTGKNEKEKARLYGEVRLYSAWLGYNWEKKIFVASGRFEASATIKG